MTQWVAFLRGVNLGKRKVLSSDLTQCFSGLGLGGVKTLLASGNVLFEADAADDLVQRIEAKLQETFGFAVPVVLRTQGELKAMIAARPFADRREDADTKLYVVLLGSDLPEGIVLESIPGDVTVAHVARREIYLIAHKLPNGRYGEGMDRVGRALGKGILATTRNWNTVLKAAA